MGDILEILTQNVELKKGQCAVDFRINEVSKNHNKRAFRVLFECKSNDALYHGISSIVTKKIMVKSKRTKRKNSSVKTKTKSKEKKKRKREVVKSYVSEHDSDDLDDDLANDCDKEPMRKKQRRSNKNFDHHLNATLGPNGHRNHTQYVPPAITGILPSIRPGALPRIGHDPPPYALLSKEEKHLSLACE